jgi:hypothetical protein
MELHALFDGCLLRRCGRSRTSQTAITSSNLE